MSGPALDWRPRLSGAQRRVHAGQYVRLEPLDPPRHAAALYHAVAEADPALWTYMGYGPFADAATFRTWAEAQAASADPLFFAMIDQTEGQAGGMASFLRDTPAHGVIEIGHIWFAPRLQRTRAASEAIYLMMGHAFEDMGYRRLEWKCDAGNAASRRAAQRFGFRHEGVFRQHMVVKGRNRDTAWYALLDHEWPAVKRCFGRWLAPENFDAAGRQRDSLSALTTALQPSPADGEGRQFPRRPPG